MESRSIPLQKEGNMKKTKPKNYSISSGAEAGARAGAGIKSWPKDERPREKLFKEGEHKLSNTELLAILLRSGIKGQSAIDLARKILQKFNTFRNMSHTDLSLWKEFKGLGQAKIAQIKAAIEINKAFFEIEIALESALLRNSNNPFLCGMDSGRFFHNHSFIS